MKTNQIIEAKYKLTATEARMISLLASVIEKDAQDSKEYRFKISELLELIGLGNQNYSELKNLTQSLMKKILKIKYEKNTIQVSFLSSVNYHDGQGIIDFSFSPHLKPYLLDLKENFIQDRLDKILCLKSFYSFRIYELLIKYEKIGKFKLSIEKIKELFEVDSSTYEKYSNFKQRILLIAQEELKEKTDLYFEFNEIKFGRKVNEIEFIIKKNKKENLKIQIKKMKTKAKKAKCIIMITGEKREIINVTEDADIKFFNEETNEEEYIFAKEALNCSFED